MNIRAEQFFDGLKNKNITFLGIGVSHTQLIKLFAQMGANVTACDKRDENALGELIKELKSLGVSLHLGENYLKDLHGDMIFRTPGLNFYTEELIQAREKGCIITSELELFMDLCPCPIIGITGSDGKTTTTTIIARLLEKQGYNVHLGGNLGRPLLPIVMDISCDDIAVVELSSFQLISMGHSPDIGVITNISPNHLDMHKDMKEYIFAKRNIVAHQNGFSMGVLNEDNPLSIESSSLMRGRKSTFSMKHSVTNGAWLDSDGYICITKNTITTKILNKDDIKLPGLHNVENYLAAFTTTMNYVSFNIMTEIAVSFGGVEHRIELVREHNGVRWYNDSIATSPTRTIAGISCFDKPIIVIAGGYDKHLPFDVLSPYIVNHVKELILMGDTAEKIEKAVTSHKDYIPVKTKIIHVKDMEEAVNKASDTAVDKDIVILSPACASYDMYKNFEIRGKHFKELVNGLK